MNDVYDAVSCGEVIFSLSLYGRHVISSVPFGECSDSKYGWNSHIRLYIIARLRIKLY